MPRLRRIHYASIGHRDARLAPLTLDLTGPEGPATDSVIWLRNGGGKSSLLNLFFSIFRPSLGDFLGKAVDGQSRHLADYVKAEDTAFVLTEWEVGTAQQGLGLDGPATRVVGQVMEWRGRQRSSDTSRLQRRFFSLRTDAEIGWHDLPVHGIATSAVSSQEAFLEWLRGVRDERPAREVVIEEQQGRWVRYLESIHLDPELFRYQLRMNRREGAADEAFRFSTARAFVEFFLELTLDTKRADQVSANLSELREKLQRLPAHRSENAFLKRATGALTPLVDAAAALRAAQAEESSARAAAGGLAGALESAVQGEDKRLADLDGRLAEMQGRRQQLDTEDRRLNRWAEGLERRAVELDLAEAEAAHAESIRVCAHARRRLRLLDAVPLWRERERLAARCRDLRASLEQEQHEQAPIIERLRVQGSALQAALSTATHEAEALVEARARSAGEAEAARDAAREGENAARAAEVAAQKDAEHLRRQLAERDRAREDLARRGVVEKREAVADAQERQAAALKRAQEEEAESETRVSVLTQEREVLRENVATLRQEHGVAREQARAERSRLEEAQTERETLERDRALLEVEEDAERAEVFALGLQERLLETAAADETRLRRSAVEGAEDERASAGWEDSGLLPPSLDVERVVARLREAGLGAFSAQEYMAQNLHNDRDRKAALLAADPARFAGVLVPPGELERVHGIPNLDRDLRTPVMIAAMAVAPERDPEAPAMVAGPEGAGTYDHGAAASEILTIRERSSQRQKREDRLRMRAQRLRAIAAQVGRFVERWGHGRWEALCERVDMLDATVGRLEEELARSQEEKEALATALQEAEEARESARRDVAAATEAMRRLTDFVERHERHAEGWRVALQNAESRRTAAAHEIERARREARESEERRDEEMRRRDEARAHARALRREHDAVEWTGSEATPEALPLATARERYAQQLRELELKFGESRLQWELDRAEADERKAREQLSQALQAKEAKGDLLTTEEIAAQSELVGERVEGEQSEAREAVLASEVQERIASEKLVQARSALAALPPRVRDSADLPPDAEDANTAAACRSRAASLRAEAAAVRAALQELTAQRQTLEEARDRADRWRGTLDNWRIRIMESCEVEPGPASPLPEEADAIEALVGTTRLTVRDARQRVSDADQRVQRTAEELRALAADPGFGAQPGAWKQRLLDATDVLVEHASVLQSDLQQRIEALDHEIESLEEDRRTLLTSLLAVSDEGVDLLRAVERASRMPDSLGRWAGQPFLKVALDVPGSDEERRARLGPLVDELVEKAVIPGGLGLVQQAVLRLHGSRPLQATILKPEASRRLDRVDVVAMANFSGGERLTAAVLLYCTLVRLRARRRGHASALAGNVLLLDNPIGTCSSVPLIELQREVARAMQTQLLYTTGVDDLAALAQLPNVVRLRNAHRNRASGDQHVTEEQGEVTGVRIVRRREAAAPDP